MSFKDQPFAARFATMGDPAEGKFEEVWPDKWVRFGLNRPPLNISALPHRVRFAPDYLTSTNFVECKGMGRDQKLKIKVIEHQCGEYWNSLHPLVYFVWDSHRGRHGTFSIRQFDDWIDAGHCELGYFPEGRAYWSIPARVIFAKVEELV